ncbi:hypothetical protein B484DRAFT_426788 [Ochromonadaceae sp. CCMP2298]|nr:hypothetical protein B484DRAFT_426788 [Ochromonadaceae sp. CCMP2298]
MHLRSMRRQVYQIARDSNGGLPLLTLWVTLDLPQALSRNAQRTEEQRVPEETLRRIHSQMQPPGADICDRHWAAVEGEDGSITEGIHALLERAQLLWHTHMQQEQQQREQKEQEQQDQREQEQQREQRGQGQGQERGREAQQDGATSRGGLVHTVQGHTGMGYTGGAGQAVQQLDALLRNVSGCVFVSVCEWV